MLRRKITGYFRSALFKTASFPNDFQLALRVHGTNTGVQKPTVTVRN